MTQLIIDFILLFIDECTNDLKVVLNKAGDDLFFYFK